jgi:nucleoside-diphosphate-sugar epimerase
MHKSTLCATGSTGLIGRYLSSNVEPFEGDLLNGEWVYRNNLNTFQTLIHLAGVVGEKNVLKDKEFAHRVNVEATKRLAEFIRDETNVNFLYVSSSHVYKGKSSELVEQDVIAPLNTYGLQKATAEEALLRIFSSQLDRLKIVRVFSILNLGMPEGSLGWAIENSQRTPVRFGDDIRDFLSAKQVARTIEKLAQLSFNANIVNICTGIPTSIKNSISLLLNIKDSEQLSRLYENGQSSSPVILGNPELLKSILDGHELKWEFLK